MQTDIKMILDRWLDEDDWDAFELINDRAECASFEQLSVFPHDDGTYAVCRPLDDFGNPCGQMLIFMIYEDGGEYKIDVVTDEFVQDMIMDEFRDMRGSDEDLDDLGDLGDDGFGDDDDDEDVSDDEELSGNGYRVYDAEEGDADLSALDKTAGDR